MRSLSWTINAAYYYLYYEVGLRQRTEELIVFLFVCMFDLHFIYLAGSVQTVDAVQIAQANSLPYSLPL